MKRDERLNEIFAHPLIQSMLTADPRLRELLLCGGMKAREGTRWQAYEDLKKQAKGLNIPDTAHYNAIIWAFDLLLPDIADPDAELTGEDYRQEM